MKARVISLMWGTAWADYGRRFYTTFLDKGPREAELVIFTDRYIEEAPLASQVMLRGLPAYNEFMREHDCDLKAEGRLSKDRKAVPGKRFWKHDAVKWAPQAIVPEAALTGLERGDILAWFDADVTFDRKVPEGWLEELIGKGEIATLWRSRQHPEIGCWIARITSRSSAAIREFARLYTSGRIFALPEWHSAYAFQHAIRSIPEALRTNLNPGLGNGHPWPSTPLAKYTTHHKGKLKEGLK